MVLFEISAHRLQRKKKRIIYGWTGTKSWEMVGAAGL